MSEAGSSQPAAADEAPFEAGSSDHVEEGEEHSHGSEHSGDRGSAATASAAPAQPADNSDDDEEGDGEGAQEDGTGGEGEVSLATGVPANEVKNIILQVLSPYFDDDGGAGGNMGEEVDDEEDTAQRYDHARAHTWIPLICDGIMERLIGLDKPFKYVVHCMVMRKCGAGMHVCSSNYYAQSDGWLSHAHDLSPHIYSVVTVYWSAI